MGVNGFTGVHTLFIYVIVLFTTAAYIQYCCSVGGNNDKAGLIRPNGWYAVDISMVLNAMFRGRGKTDFMRLQQCNPPMPTRQVVFSFMDQWYKVHSLEEAFLIFVFDGRRCPHKRRFEKQKADRAKAIAKSKRARNLKTLEKYLLELLEVDADVIFWVKEWVRVRKLDKKVFLFGTPFEADAQLVQLERQGVVDAIITDDSKSSVMQHP